MSDIETKSTPPQDLADTRPMSQLVHPIWWLLGIGILLAVAALLVDQPASDYLSDEVVRERVYNLFWIPAAAGLYFFLLAILASFPNWRRLYVGFFAAVLLTALMTHALKWSVGRARPHQELGQWTCRPFSWDGSFESFPSGHSSGAIALAILLGIYFPRARWIFYFYAGMMGLERIVHYKHFLSDVLAGYVIGILATWICIRALGASFYQKDWRPTTLEPLN
ncbi:MAG: phosphatase PAP2 family protein [Planctomycetota bacterium]